MIEIENFLAQYRLYYAVGYYASQRYFEDFAKNGVFIKHINGKTFTIDYKEANRFGTIYKVDFPDPDPKGEQDGK